MRKTFLTVAAAAAVLSLASCQRNTEPEAPAPQNGPLRGTAEIVVNIHGAPVTKADAATQNDENRMNSVEVFVFDAQSGSITEGMLEAYKKAEESEITGDHNTTAAIRFNTTTGDKHIYVIANARNNNAISPAAPLANNIGTEDELRAAVTLFQENALAAGSEKTSFIMAGGCASTLTQGTNPVNVSLRRIVSRVKLEKVTGAFTSPALQAATITVKKLYLVNVPKRAKLINGNYSDVFGVTSEYSAYPSTDATHYPEGFIASSDLMYYSYAVPPFTGEGYWNFMNPASFVGGTTTSAQFLSTEGSVPALTQYVTGSAEGVLYGTGANVNHNYLPGKYFYSYPNAAPAERSDAEAFDYTTKLVIETEVKLSGRTVTSFYPISIPYMQPNYAYTVENVTITRLGSNNPFRPVTTAECTFNVTVHDWDTGEITGSFNNETTEGNFVI